MPFYEYGCSACGHEFEELQKITDKPIKKCPTCGKNKVQKKVSLSGFQLKGEGWYKDGYARPSEKPAPKTDTKTKEKNSTKKESKTKSSGDKKTTKTKTAS